MLEKSHDHPSDSPVQELVKASSPVLKASQPDGRAASRLTPDCASGLLVSGRTCYLASQSKTVHPGTGLRAFRINALAR
jgi:hypothetical protein